MKRRQFLLSCAAALLGGNAAAQTPAFPTKPVKLVIPYPAGGATDVIGRMIAEPLAKKWAQPVIVENHPGAGATVGAEFVARSAPDGYTLLETTAAHTISASLYRKLSYDPIKDFAAITLIATVPLVLVAGPTVPAKNLKDLVAWAKSRPNGITIASTGNGTAQHLTGELFKKREGINAVHVPYKGDAPMITDLIGGQVEITFATLSAVLPYIRSGKLTAIALAHTHRMSALPDVPTTTEAGLPDFIAATWFGIFSPAGVPDGIRQRIYKDISAIVSTPSMTQQIIDMGGEVDNYSPSQFDAFIQKESARWAEAVRISGAQIN